MTGIRIDRGVAKAAAVTLAAAGFYRLLQQLVTFPGLDLSVLAEWFPGSGAPPGLPEGGSVQLAALWIPHAVSGTAAIGTYVSASVLVLLLSGVLPFLRRLRESGVSNQAGFQWVIAAATALLAAAHGLGTALYLGGNLTARCRGCPRFLPPDGPSARERC